MNPQKIPPKTAHLSPALEPLQDPSTSAPGRLLRHGQTWATERFLMGYVGLSETYGLKQFRYVYIYIIVYIYIYTVSFFLIAIECGIPHVLGKPK